MNILKLNQHIITNNCKVKLHDNRRTVGTLNLSIIYIKIAILEDVEEGNAKRIFNISKNLGQIRLRYDSFNVK